jgi:amino acid adenylation domain-containing protein
MDDRIDRFYAETGLLDGREIVERPHWNTVASADAIRHFAYGTSDDNPLWLDEAYAESTAHGGLLAPPAFVCSVLYPFLHGAPVDAPLASLIGEISIDWSRVIRAGDRLRASARQTGITESLDRRGRRIFFVHAETTYWNQEDSVVATANGTMVRIAREENDLLLDRKPSGYSDEERDALGRAIADESRAGGESLTAEEAWIGGPLPVMMRGPLTIGDLVCWQAAIGPSYRAGSLGYLDAMAAPHTAAVNPVTGWPVKYSQQHEDFLLAAQRGMPAPFDNSLMRFAWMAPMLTDWMGDEGFLKRLSVQTGAPMIYGDTTWYRGVVVDKRPAPAGDAVDVRIRITGVNQLGATTTTGDAVVTLPSRRIGSRPARRGAGRRSSLRTILDSFSDAVRANGDRVAIAGRRRSVSFAELDARSDRAAERLSDLGCGPGSVVGLLFPRVPDVLVAMLGVLKAGAAYLPLEWEAGAERARAVVDAVRPALIVHADGAEQAAAVSVARESGGRAAAWREVDTPGASAGPWRRTSLGKHDLAYVMPTSGTVGAPRCVAVPHGSFARYLAGLLPCLGYRPDDVCLQSAAFHFSASVRQLFAGLCAGATSIMLDEEQRKDPREILRVIRERGVTAWDTVPSVWQAAIDTLLLLPPAERRELLDNRLRIVTATGERLRWQAPDAWRNRLGQSSRMVNLYSQTETAGTTCAFEITRIEGADDEVVPLGSALADVTIEILDDKTRQPVGAGEIGEICVRGPRLAAGYVAQPELTAERFPLAPFRHEGFFRTGDLGRFDEQGRLRFAGRGDLRVKIRGQTVDTEAVEQALETCPGIAAAAVVCRESVDHIASLVAFVVPREGREPPSTPSIVAHLRRILPDAAVPSPILFLDELPRNAAGKVDRASLPSPPAGPAEAIDEADPVLAVVRKLFLEVLETGALDDEQNFFDAGGNSLMATRVVARLRRQFAIDLPLKRFFDAPSVAGVSKVVEDLLIGEIEALTEDEAARLLED